MRTSRVCSSPRPARLPPTVPIVRQTAPSISLNTMSWSPYNRQQLAPERLGPQNVRAAGGQILTRALEDRMTPEEDSPVGVARWQAMEARVNALSSTIKSVLTILVLRGVLSR